MNEHIEAHEPERYEFTEKPRYRFSLSRRAFMQVTGAGLLITSAGGISFAQRPSSGSRTLGGRFHIDKSGVVTAFTSKVEVGQGARTQLTMAAAEELRVPMDQVRLVMADTALVPDDGGTYGSLTTPRTVPTMRSAAAAAREILIELAADEMKVDPSAVSLRDGVFEAGKTRITLAELSSALDDVNESFQGQTPEDAAVAPPDAWRVLGTTPPKPNARDIVTGAHRYPSDVRAEGTVYGKVLRPPSYNAKLKSVDLSAAKAMKGVEAVQDGDFVGCVAPTMHQARLGVEAIAKTAQWEEQAQVSSAELFKHLKANVREGTGRNRGRENAEGDVDAAIRDAAKVVRAEYHVPYIQHAPMEPRAALAEWKDGAITVWTGSQRPSGVRDELVQAFGVSESKARVIIPDTGGGFGGKHTGDAAIEAARLAQAVKKPVSLQWTREEEFTWAYFRPAGVLTITAAIDGDKTVTGFDFTNYNSGASGLDCPYTFANKRVAFKTCESPLREGSYRALASTANNFARETFIDRLAAETGEDPVEFRVRYLAEDRLRNVVKAAAEAFDWKNKRASGGDGAGCGTACGTEKGSFVATCAEVEVDAAAKNCVCGDW